MTYWKRGRLSCRIVTSSLNTGFGIYWAELWSRLLYHLHRKTCWSTVVVSRTRHEYGKKIFMGMSSFHFHDFFSEDRIKGDPSQKVWNKLKTSKWNAHFPFGNSVWEFLSTSVSRNPVFQIKFLFGETKLIFPFTFHPKFPEFLSKW